MHDVSYYLFAMLLFLAVVLLFEGVYVWWNDSRGPEAKRIERRLRLMFAGAQEGGERLSILKTRMLSDTPSVQRLLLAVPRVHRLDRLLEQSGLSWSVAQFLTLTFAGAALGLALALVLGASAGWTIVACIAVAALPLVHVLARKSKRLVEIDRQLPDAMDMMSRALRAGHAFPSALKMVGDEMNDPIAAEFRVAFDEVNYGIPMQDALLNLATRVPITDFRYFVIAVLIQRETGGNLAELLGNIAAIIRARHKLTGTIRVLSAEGRLSAWILCALPFVLAGAISLLNPEFLGVLRTDPVGIRLVMGALVMMLIGVLWIRSIVRIRV
jgi:tight adherence protein B